MAIQTKVDSTGKEYTEIWGGTPGSPTLHARFDADGIHGTQAVDSPLADTVSLRAPLVMAGDADAQQTARTGGTIRAPDVAVGGAGNVAGADVTIRPGKGTGTGTPGNLILQAAPAAAAGDNLQVPATVATLSSTGLELAAAKTLTAPLAVVSTSATTPKVIGGTAVGSDLTLQSTSGVGDGTDTILMKVGNNGGTTVATARATGVEFAKPIIGTPEALAAPGAVSIATLVTEITTDGGANEDAFTLADGAVVGQLKVVACKAVGNAGDSYKVTPATFLGGTKITFGANCIGKGAVFLWTAAGWIVVGNNGGTVS